MTLVSDNTACGTANGELTADADGAGTTAGHTFEWYYGNNTSVGNLFFCINDTYWL